jgi:hypothetical protein
LWVAGSTASGWLMLLEKLDQCVWTTRSSNSKIMPYIQKWAQCLWKLGLRDNISLTASSLPYTRYPARLVRRVVCLSCLFTWLTLISLLPPNPKPKIALLRDSALADTMHCIPVWKHMKNWNTSCKLFYYIVVCHSSIVLPWCANLLAHVKICIK